jgi:Kdo2-lipid IVA lauroyltransferase/acyltransferase
MKRKKYLQNYLEFILFMVFIKLFRLLPYSLAKRLLVNLFVLLGFHVGIRKKIALEQLEHAFPEKTKQECLKILRDSYISMAITAFELFIPHKKDFRQITVDGWENIEESLALNRGLILVGGHIGNWELAGRFFTDRGIPLNVIIKRLRNSRINDYINRLRKRDKIEIIYKNKALKPVLKALKQNEMVVMLIDQDAGKEGIVLPFLNKKASVFTGFVRLADRYDTPLVLGISHRKENGSYHLTFEKPVLPSTFRSKEGYPDNLACFFHKRLEEYVEACPEQWFWIHRRWKGAEKARRIISDN